MDVLVAPPACRLEYRRVWQLWHIFLCQIDLHMINDISARVMYLGMEGKGVAVTHGLKQYGGGQMISISLMH